MKKVWLALILGALAGMAQAVVPGQWNYSSGIHVKEVELRGDGFYFTLRNPAAGDDLKYGILNSFSSYDVLVTMILTAKAGSIPITFYVEPDGEAVKTISVNGQTIVSLGGVDLVR